MENKNVKNLKINIEKVDNIIEEEVNRRIKNKIKNFAMGFAIVGTIIGTPFAAIEAVKREDEYLNQQAKARVEDRNERYLSVNHEDEEDNFEIEGNGYTGSYHSR